MNQNKKHLFRIKRLYQHVSNNSTFSEISRINCIILLDFIVESILKLILSSHPPTQKQKKQKLSQNLDFFMVCDEASIIIRDPKNNINLDDLPFKRDVKKLHKHRNLVAHEGVIPSIEESETSLVMVNSFLKDIYEQIFNLNFDKLYWSSLINDKVIRQQIVKSEKFLEEGDYIKSISHASVAFHEMINIAKEDLFNPWSGSYFPSHNFNDPFEMVESRVEDAFDNVKDKINEIEEFLYLISAGLNIKDYHRFSYITPKVWKRAEDYSIRIYSKKNFTHENAIFVNNYVIDQILNLEDGGIKRNAKGQKEKLNVNIEVRIQPKLF